MAKQKHKNKSKNILFLSIVKTDNTPDVDSKYNSVSSKQN